MFLVNFAYKERKATASGRFLQKNGKMLPLVYGITFLPCPFA
jgi:hypothetical protein